MSVVLPSSFETIALYSVVGISIGALFYALFLRKQTLKESTGSDKLHTVWSGIKSGANAYLRTQLRSVVIFVGVLGIFLYVASALVPPVAVETDPFWITIGRVGAFLMGAFFSAMVGFFGMNMAVQGNIRVAEAYSHISVMDAAVFNATALISPVERNIIKITRFAPPHNGIIHRFA